MRAQAGVEALNTLFAAGLVNETWRGKQPAQWECKLKETLVGEYLIVPLNSAKMLKSEGYLMNNCCRDYIFRCADLAYSLFSIRSRSGERLATLGLGYENGYWHFDQCFGQANSEVLEESLEYFDEDGVLRTEYFPTEIYYLAHEVVRLMNAKPQSH